jgi:alcohol dehydrogenase class IV
MGLQRAHLAGIADAALLDHCHLTNPRTATREDYLQMLDSAF